MDSWVGVGFYSFLVLSIPRLKSIGLKNVPIYFCFGLEMVGAEALLQAMSVEPQPNSRLSTTSTRFFQPWMDKVLFDCMDGESTHPSIIKPWINCENNLVKGYNRKYQASSYQYFHSFIIYLFTYLLVYQKIENSKENTLRKFQLSNI